MKKFVMKLDLQDDKEKRKAMKIVSALLGIDEISIDLKGKKLTIIGTADPVTVASKLRKHWPTTDILLVGPAKEPEKKEEAKKEEPKKEEPKKEEPKKEEGKEEAKKEDPKKEDAKKEEGKKEEPKKEEEKKVEPAPAPLALPMPMPMPMQMQMPPVGTAFPYRPYYPPMQTYYHVYPSMEENPNACVIC